MRKLAALGLLSALAALATMAGPLTGPALAGSAKQPVIGTFSINDTNVDPGVSAACGFTVTETDTGTGRYEVFFDSTGTPVRAQVEEHYTGVFTANGLAVDTAGATLSIFDLNGGETDAGINIRVPLLEEAYCTSIGVGWSSTTTATSYPRQALTRVCPATSMASAPP